MFNMLRKFKIAEHSVADKLPEFCYICQIDGRLLNTFIPNWTVYSNSQRIIIVVIFPNNRSEILILLLIISFTKWTHFVGFLKLFGIFYNNPLIVIHTYAFYLKIFTDLGHPLIDLIKGRSSPTDLAAQPTKLTHPIQGTNLIM